VLPVCTNLCPVLVIIVLQPRESKCLVSSPGASSKGEAATFQPTSKLITCSVIVGRPLYLSPARLAACSLMLSVCYESTHLGISPGDTYPCGMPRSYAARRSASACSGVGWYIGSHSVD
jgi:hypothetical protein